MRNAVTVIQSTRPGTVPCRVVCRDTVYHFYQVKVAYRYSYCTCLVVVYPGDMKNPPRGGNADTKMYLRVARNIWRTVYAGRSPCVPGTLRCRRRIRSVPVSVKVPVKWLRHQVKFSIGNGMQGSSSHELSGDDVIS